MKESRISGLDGEGGPLSDPIATFGPRRQGESDPLAWVRGTYKGFEDNRKRWDRVWMHYTCDVDNLRSSDVLIQRGQGEADLNYEERRKLADYTPLLSMAVSAMRGRIARIEADPTKTRRNWGALGDLAKKGSHAYRLAHDADGKCNDYLTLMEKALTRAILFEEVWAMVDGSHLRVISPSAVWDYDTSSHNPRWCKVYHQTDVRDRPDQSPDERSRWTLYTLDGFEIFEEREDEWGNKGIVSLTGGAVPYGGSADDPLYFYESAEAARAGDMARRILPIFRVTLPLEWHVGYALACKNEVIFNQESERDNILRIACTPSLQFVGNDDEFLKMVEQRKSGANVYQLAKDAQRGHAYLAPPTEPAQERRLTLVEKYKAFMLSAFRAYEDAAGRRDRVTATEVNTREGGNASAFLGALSTTLNELEANWMLRLEQAVFPLSPNLWDGFSVERQRDYRPLDNPEDYDRLIRRYFGGDQVPAPAAVRAAVARRVYEKDGIPFTDDDVEAGAFAAVDGRAGQLVDLARMIPWQAAAQLAGYTDKEMQLLSADMSDVEK